MWITEPMGCFLWVKLMVSGCRVQKQSTYWGAPSVGSGWDHYPLQHCPCRPASRDGCRLLLQRRIGLYRCPRLLAQLSRQCQRVRCICLDFRMRLSQYGSVCGSLQFRHAHRVIRLAQSLGTPDPVSEEDRPSPPAEVCLKNILHYDQDAELRRLA